MPLIDKLFDLITPKALNVDNPVQAVGAARGRENRQHLSVLCCAPTEHRFSTLHHLTPRCARGYPHYTPMACFRHSAGRNLEQWI